LPPSVNYVALDGTATDGNSPVRYWFEEGIYLYCIGVRSILKLQPTAGGFTIIYNLLDVVANNAAFNLDDFLGRPVKAVSTLGGTRWFIPTNNGDRILRLSTVDGGGGGLDTWAAVTSVLEGAAHFRALPSGKIVRANSSFSAGTFQSRAEISILPAGAVFETDANWGGDFAAGDQTKFITGLTVYDELTIVHKTDAHLSAIENTDLTISYRDLLPEASASNLEPANPLAVDTHEGFVWHNRLYAPTVADLWRHNLSSAIPIGPDSILENQVDAVVPASATVPSIRHGIVPTGIGAGGWCYVPYGRGAFGYASQLLGILAGREGRRHEMDWHHLYSFESGGAQSRCQGIYIQRTGPSDAVTGPPRLIWHEYDPGGTASTLGWIALGQDRSPLRLVGNTGNASTSYHAWTQEIAFQSLTLMRELRLQIDGGGANVSWSANLYREGSPTAQPIGTSRTNSGSLFMAEVSADQMDRAILEIIATAGAGFVPGSGQEARGRLRKATLEFTYMPDVSDDLQFVVDVGATAKRRRVSEKSVRDTLRTLRSGGALTWVDPYGAAGFIFVSATSDQAPKKMAALEIMEVVTVRGTLLEYS
jgi:hypothetical protein